MRELILSKRMHKKILSGEEGNLKLNLRFFSDLSLGDKRKQVLTVVVVRVIWPS
jgi:hypothetical protein